MKDPNDHKTVDGFADLVTLVESAPPLKKRGRPTLGDRPLSPAEKQKAYRDRKRAEREKEQERLQAIRSGDPVMSTLIDLETRFPDALALLKK